MATGMQRVYALHSAFRMTDMVEIEAAIKPCQLLVASFHPSNQFKSGGVVILGTLLFRAFKLTNNIEYLNEAILILREGLNLPNAERFRVVTAEVTLFSHPFYVRLLM